MLGRGVPPVPLGPDLPLREEPVQVPESTGVRIGREDSCEPR